MLKYTELKSTDRQDLMEVLAALQAVHGADRAVEPVQFPLHPVLPEPEEVPPISPGTE